MRVEWVVSNGGMGSFLLLDHQKCLVVLSEGNSLRCLFGPVVFDAERMGGLDGFDVGEEIETGFGLGLRVGCPQEGGDDHDP